MIPQLSIEAFSELMGIALLQGVALTIFIQQSLRPVFEYRHFAPKIDGKGIKWPATLLVCVFICLLSDFDLASTILKTNLGFIGQLLTGLFLSGGTKSFGQLIGQIKRGING